MQLFAPPPILYLITDRKQYLPCSETDSWTRQLQAIETAVKAGCQAVQIREKDLTPSALTDFTREVVRLVAPHSAKVLVNDSVEVALATNADGVHLRSTSGSAQAVRDYVRDASFLIGVSTHSLREVERAQQDGADFAVCGPVFYTASKANLGLPLGLSTFAAICQASAFPILGLGGIKMNNFSDVLVAGAQGIAGIGLFRARASLGTDIKIMLSSRLTPQDSV